MPSKSQLNDRVRYLLETLMFAEDLLAEIDATLEHLICNAETLQGVDFEDLTEEEIDAFQKTQESLIHRLMNMDQAFETRRVQLRVQDKKSAGYKIQEKRIRFEKLKNEVNNTIQITAKKLPLLVKRRGKRVLR